MKTTLASGAICRRWNVLLWVAQHFKQSLKCAVKAIAQPLSLISTYMVARFVVTADMIQTKLHKCKKVEAWGYGNEQNMHQSKPLSHRPL